MLGDFTSTPNEHEHEYEHAHTIHGLHIGLTTHSKQGKTIPKPEE